MQTQIEAHDIAFVAPIPAGNQVLIARVRRSEGESWTPTLVLDVSSKALYRNDTLYGPLSNDVLSTTDPLAVLTRWSWKVVKVSEGRVVGCIVSTTGTGDSNTATRLFVETTGAAAPYRG